MWLRVGECLCARRNKLSTRSLHIKHCSFVAVFAPCAVLLPSSLCAVRVVPLSGSRANLWPGPKCACASACSALGLPLSFGSLAGSLARRKCKMSGEGNGRERNKDKGEGEGEAGQRTVPPSQAPAPSPVPRVAHGGGGGNNPQANQSRRTFPSPITVQSSESRGTKKGTEPKQQKQKQKEPQEQAALGSLRGKLLSSSNNNNSESRQLQLLRARIGSQTNEIDMHTTTATHSRQPASLRGIN